MINQWVEDQTKEKIKNIVPEGLPTPDTRLVLGNAIYFKASWAEQFKAKWTRTEPFTMSKGKTLDVSMMHLEKKYRYAATDDAQIVEIPYRGGVTSMVVVLPKKKDGLAAIEATLSSTLVDSWQRRLRSRLVQLKLPRFEFTSSFDLTTKLPAMGMADAFDGTRADFSAMTTEQRLFIGAVLHKSFVAVDESGTEAAAATIVLMELGSAMPRDKPVPFIADHPFLFFIQHVKSGCVMFAGRVTKPTGAEAGAKPKKRR